MLAVWRAEAMLATPDCAGRCRRARARGSHSFLPRANWRGPVWPVMNWLFGVSLRRSARRTDADALVRAACAQVREIGFAGVRRAVHRRAARVARPVVTAAVTLDCSPAAPESIAGHCPFHARDDAINGLQGWAIACVLGFPAVVEVSDAASCARR